MKKNTLLYGSVLLALVLLALLAAVLFSKKYYESRECTWRGDFDSRNEAVLIRGKKIDAIRDDIAKLIYAINESEQDPETFRTPEGKEPVNPPKLKLVEIKGEVATVEVINAEYLTQRMGTTGADMFLAEATFTLTEHKNIKFISFVFDPGDHASPGIYARKHFIDRWRIIK